MFCCTRTCNEVFSFSSQKRCFFAQRSARSVAQFRSISQFKHTLEVVQRSDRFHKIWLLLLVLLSGSNVAKLVNVQIFVCIYLLIFDYDLFLVKRLVDQME